MGSCLNHVPWERKFVHSLRNKLNIERFLCLKFLKREISEYVLTISVLTYTTIFSYFTLLKHSAFQTNAWDLGLFNQSFWTTLNDGRFFFHTLEPFLNPNGGFFAVHFSPILLALLPIYALFQHPETLLVLQSFILASAAIPLYLLVKENFQNRTIALVLVLAYLGYPALQGINWFDFHVQALFIPFLFSAFYFFEKKKWKTYLLFIILTLMVEEQVAIILILYGLYIFWSFKNSLHDAIKNRLWKSPLILIPTITILLSISYLVTAGFVKSVLFPINPDFSTVYKAVVNWSVLGIKTDLMQIPVFALLNPASALNALSYDFATKFLFLIFLFAPLAFLSLRSSKILVTLGWLGPALLSNNPSYYLLGNQYPAYIIPFIFAAAISAMKTISKDNLRTALEISKVLLILTIIFMIALSPISPLPKYFTSQYVPPQVTDHDRILQQAIAIIPSNASILTQNNIFPHVSSRSNAYAIYTQPSSPSLKQKIDAFTDNITSDVQYILVDLTSDASAFEYALGRALNGHYGVYFSSDRVLLYKLNYAGAPYVYTPITESYNFLNLTLGNGETTGDSSARSGTVLLYPSNSTPMNVFWSGPYTPLPPDNYSVDFCLKVASNAEEGHLLTLDVVANSGKTLLASRELSQTDFDQPLTWQNFTLSFQIDRPYTNVEFRGFFPSNSTDMFLDYIHLGQQG